MPVGMELPTDWMFISSYSRRKSALTQKYCKSYKLALSSNLFLIKRVCRKNLKPLERPVLSFRRVTRGSLVHLDASAQTMRTT